MIDPSTLNLEALPSVPLAQRDQLPATPSISIQASFDCTQRQLIASIAWTIYEKLGYRAPSPLSKPLYFFESQHPQERACLNAALEIFELFWGDSPDYSDEDED